MLNLYTDAFEFIDSKIRFYKKRVKYLKKINIFLNCILIFTGFVTTTLTSLILSKLLYNFFPDWFFYYTAGITAATGLATSLLNFFVIKDNIKVYSNNINRIKAEIISYFQKTKKIYQNKSLEKNQYFLFLSVSSIIGSSIAKKEIKNYGK